LREPGLGKNVAIGLATALVLVAAIVPALPQSYAIADRSTGADILRNPSPADQIAE
jgi:hypothetical protein